MHRTLASAEHRDRTSAQEPDAVRAARAGLTADAKTRRSGEPDLLVFHPTAHANRRSPLARRVLVDLSERPAEAAGAASNRRPRDLLRIVRAARRERFDAFLFPSLHTWFPRCGAPAVVGLHDTITIDHDRSPVTIDFLLGALRARASLSPQLDGEPALVYLHRRGRQDRPPGCPRPRSTWRSARRSRSEYSRRPEVCPFETCLRGAFARREVVPSQI